jgi:alpha-tubulin suppressor-like RCC1 family protein
MPITYPYVQYSGIWTTSQATDAVAAGNWAKPPAPHLFAWGKNNFGQLGLGNTTYYSSPKQVGSLTNWSSISSGNVHTVALKTDGTLWAWGKNNSGQLGLNNTTSYSSPKQVGALNNWLFVKASGYFTAAIKTDGTLWTWGQNYHGQLGLGNTTYYSSPMQVGSLTTWATLTLTYFDMLAIQTDGTLWGWGYNVDGEIGIGNKTNYSSPKQVGALTNWQNVYSGDVPSVFATKSDGTLWSWGLNTSGQLGLGNTTNYSSPKQIGALTTWGSSIVAVGYGHVLANKSNNTLWAWGSNNFGQLGLGNTTSYSSPVQVGSLTNWLSVSTGYFNSISLKSDGTLWSWGYNNRGQLGLGNTTNYSSPKQVGSLTSWLTIASGIYATFGIAKT